MQLDKTRIVIRERSFPDILDLSLRVIREHFLPLLATTLIGAVPMILLNNWLLSESLQEENLEIFWSWDGAWGFFFGNLFWVVWELPLATSLTTLYLGQALFVDKPSAGRVAKDFLASLPQLILFQVVLRGILTLLLVTWLVLFMVWPYLNEILLLERNPWRKKREPGTSTLGRAAAMHGGNYSELLARWLCSLLIGLAMIAAIWGSMWYLRAWLTYRVEFDRALYAVYLQAAIWTVLGYLTVVRFLSYLDLRIRTEGWEIELAMRAEALRLTRQLA